MSKLFAVMFVLLTASTAFAQGALSGYLATYSTEQQQFVQEKRANVEVALWPLTRDGYSAKAKTDSHGEFAFFNVPDGSYYVEARDACFRGASIAVEIYSGRYAINVRVVNDGQKYDGCKRRVEDGPLYSSMAGCERIEGLCTALENVALVEIAFANQQRARVAVDRNATRFNLSMSVFAGLQVADVWLTHIGRSSGRAVEANPIMDMPTSGQVAAKAATTTITWFLLSKLNAKKPKTTQIVLWSMNAVMIGVVHHNSQFARGTKR